MPTSRASLEEAFLVLGNIKVAAEQLRIHANDPPSRHIHPPPIVANMAQVSVAAFGGDHATVSTGNILVVADVMTARNEPYGRREPLVQTSRLGKILSIVDTVQRDVAGVNHEIRRFAPDRICDPTKVGNEEWLPGTEVRVGNLREAKHHGAQA